MTTIQDIEVWIRDGKRNGCTHLIVVCDMFDWGDYPVYIKEGADAARAKYQEYEDGQHEMQKVMEVYNLAGDLIAQLQAHRALEF